MEIIIFALILVVSLAVLIKGADFFIEAAKKIGVGLGMSPFVIGVLIVGLGTSLPELASAIAAVLKEETGIVVANVVGSNIANILLVVGLLALLAKKIIIRRDLLKSEIPLFVIATTHFLFIIHDGLVTRLESLLLLGTFGAYLWYIIKEPPSDLEIVEEIPIKEKIRKYKNIGLLLVGLVGIIVGAHFTIYAAVEFALLAGVPVTVVTILGIAVGTSLPELMVSLQAIKTGEVDLAVGNIFGSNAINMLLVTGVPALITNLHVDDVVMSVGIHILLAASVIFFVHGLSRRLMRWEGVMLLLFFIFFIVQLFSYIV